MPSQSSSEVHEAAWRAAITGVYEQAVEIMENPPGIGTMRELFDHRLGTYGHAYHVQNTAECYSQNAKYEAALREIATRPTVERNPDGDDQAAHTMQLIAREALGMPTDAR